MTDEEFNQALESEQQALKDYQVEHGIYQAFAFDQGHRDAIMIQLNSLLELARLQVKRSSETSRRCFELRGEDESKGLHEMDVEVWNILKQIQKLHRVKFYGRWMGNGR